MIKQSSDRLEIFLALALRREEAESFLPMADFESESLDKSALDNSLAEDFSALFEYLTEPEARKFRVIAAGYQNKTEPEKTIWRERVLRKIGTDEQLVDETVHSSHVSDALQKESRAVQKIIRERVFIGEEWNPNSEKQFEKSSPLEKTVRRAFAKQFVSVRDLPKPTAFDYLSGSELARLIRSAGIREVALACVRIEAVESVAAFLRRFPAEDARAIASQLNNLRGVSESRMAFAEHLVQTAIEIEPHPSAMLDWLGIWLTGVLLCGSSESRVRYTNQKLPLEVSAKLPEIIDEQCRNTPKDLQKKIEVEIERLAETIARAAANIKSVEAE